MLNDIALEVQGFYFIFFLIWLGSYLYIKDLS